MLGSVCRDVWLHLSAVPRNLGFCGRSFHMLSRTQYAFYHTSPPAFLKKKSEEEAKLEKDVIVRERAFRTLEEKNKSSFLRVVQSYTETVKGMRGHVEFIHAAMKCMEECNVQYDLETYKKLMNVFPKGKYIPKNMIQAEFFHFPRHQDCALELLDKMETYGVCPDGEMKELVLNTFGKRSHVYKKFCRMMYWMPKFKNLNPYALPDPLPSDIELLAELAMKKMSVDLRTKITHFKTSDLEDAVDDTWIVSAQSPLQQEILKKHAADKPVYVEGPYLIWLKRVSLSYFYLRADPVQRPTVEVDDDDVSNLSLYMFGEPKPKHLTVAPLSVHEQEDGIIYGMCATGTSSKDSVLSWIRFLQKSNPVLETIPVLFTLKTLTTALTTLNVGNRTSSSSDTDGQYKESTVEDVSEHKAFEEGQEELASENGKEQQHQRS